MDTEADKQIVETEAERVEGETAGSGAGLVNPANIGLLLGCILLGVLVNYLVMWKPLGVSYPILVLVFYAVFWSYLRGRLLTGTGFSWLIGAAVALLSLTYPLFSNELFLVLNFLLLPGLIVAHTTLLARGGQYQWHQVGFLSDILYGVFCRTLLFIGQPFRLVRDSLKFRQAREGVANRVLIGVLVALPLVFVIVGLLASADLVFESWVSRVPGSLVDLNAYELLYRTLIAVFIAVVAFSYCWSFSRERAPAPGVSPTSANPLTWDPVTVATVLVIIDLIYAAFCVLQFTYLFGGELPPGFTYSEYARRGFFELVLVTLINLGILLSCLSFTRAGSAPLSKVVRALYTFLVACTLVMLVSAFYRMALYEDAYGFTQMRILTQGFMVYLAVVLAVTGFRVWREETRLLKLYIVISLVAYLAVNFMNVDTIVARNSIERYRGTGRIDTGYLNRLSYEAVPTLVTLLDAPDQKVAAEISGGLYLKRQQLRREASWPSFNLARYRALRALEGRELHPFNPYLDEQPRFDNR
ncbi:MAG: DUF4173 domain-containing protein [Firmicutes bacterium]|nr:DUF4173 domain-containing protein [Bacillota bacterium]